MTAQIAESSKKACQTCHDLDRAKLVYWKGGPSRHRMFKRYFQHADYHSLKVPLQDLKWAASKSCPFCVIAFDIYRWIARTKGDGSRAAQSAMIEICIPFKAGPVVLTYSWGFTVPRMYDFQISIPKKATGLPWSTLTSGTQIPKDPRQSLFRAAAWLRDCLANHRGDGGACITEETHPVLPARLLYVGDGLERARLVTCRPGMAYFALSYCWGKTPHVSTTKSSYVRHLQQVPLEILPKTCRDAIYVTRALGYRYLWLDSLCILQDDRDEWSNEASRMGDIYRNAVLTISATNASHVGFGCLNHRPETRTFKNRLRKNEDDPSHVLVREPNSHINLIASPRSEEDYPLHRRAWCLQERLMSTRVLHFTAGELVWECSTSADCECGHMATAATTRLRFDQASLNKMTVDEQARSWDELALQSYQQRLLSNEDDRFPALSGLAQRFHNDSFGKYVAGLWSSYALSMLLWEVKTGRRAERYVAPSWSWASIQGTLLRSDKIVHNDHFTAKLEDMRCTLLSQDPYGAIRDAVMILDSPAADGVISSGGHHSDIMVLFNTHVKAFFVRDSVEDGHLFGAKVKCIFLRGLHMGPDERYIEALVLSPAADPTRFQRIGIAHLTKASLAHLDTLALKDERVTII